MSTTIDSRVVEMRFDNKHFENNVSTTMSTLDKLKQKLHLDGATKGLESVNTAAKKVDISGLGTAVESVQAKFSAMQVIGVTALANITNSAVNAGKRMVKALTLDPITTGFSEYETQINATQTILANTASKGSDINDVNKALEELNAYADKTIYNFTEMTRNIGTFTAAGIDLDTSVNAIQGIANLAAVSGSTSQQASTAMYQLSQALSTGTVRLMDWNSVVNAGMGGEMFQNALKKTSELLGTGAEAAIKAKGSFRESLSEGWLTAEVLTRTLKTFTTSGANEYVAEYTGLSKEAVDAALKEAEARYGEAEAIDHAAEALSKKSGKNKKEIKDALQFAKNAEDAATKVKTFTQLWDVLKESAQSGWSQTWKLIVGDFEEAKALLTPLADLLTGFINNISDWRNRILQVALDFAAPWKAISDKISKITDTVTGVTDAVSGALKPLEYFQDVVDRVWMGEFNNWGDNPDRRDLLKAAGYDPRVVQYLVNLGEEAWHSGKVYKLSMEEVEAAHKKYGLTVKSTKEETEKVTTAFNELSDEQLKNAGLTKDEIALYRALEEEADRAGISISDLAKEMSETDGRTMLVDSFKNIGGAILDMGNAIKSAWISIFNPPSAEVLGIRLYGIIRSLKEFTESLRLTDEKTGELNATGLKFQSVFKGIFAAIDIVLTVVGGPLKIVFKAATQLLGYFGLGVLDVAAFIGDAIVRFRDWIDSVLDFTKVFDKIIPPIENAIETFRNWIASLRESENLPQDIAKGIASAFGKAVDAVKKFFKKIPEFFTDGFSAFSDSPITGWVDKIRKGLGVAGKTIAILGDMIRQRLNKFLSRAQFEGVSEDSIAGLINGLKKGASKVWNAAVEMAKGLVLKVEEFLGIESPSKVFFAIGGFIIAGLVAGLQNGIPDSLGAIKDVFQPMLDWIKGIDLGAVLAGAIGIGAVSTANKIGNALAIFASPLEGLGDVLETTDDLLKKIKKPIANVVKGFAKIEKAVAFNIRMDGIKTLAISLLMLAGAIAVLTFFEPAKLWNAVGVILALAVILGVLAFALDKINSASASFNLKDGLNIQGLTSGLVGIGIAVLLLGITVKMIGSLEKEQAEQGIKRLLDIIALMLSVVVAFGIFVKGDSANNIKDFGKMMTKMAVSLLLMLAVVKIASKLEKDELAKGIYFLQVFSQFVLGLCLIALLPSKNIGELGGMMLKITFSLILMIGVIKLANRLTSDEIEAGKVFLKTFASFVGILALIGALGGKGIDGVGKMMLGISVSMLILIGVMKLIGKLTPEEFKRGLVAIVAFSAIILVLVAVVVAMGSEAPKVAATILAFSIAIGILAAVAIVCGHISTDGLKKGIAAVAALSIMMAVMLVAARGADKATGTIVSLTVAIGLLVAAVALLTLIDPVKLAITTAVMFVLMGMFALVIKVAGSAQKAMGAMIAMAAVIAVTGTILILLSDLPVEDTIGSAIALGGLLVVMTGVLAALAFIGKFAKDALMGVLALAAMAAPMALFGLVLAMMSALKVKDAIPNVIALSALCTVLTALLIPLSVIGALVFATGGIILLGVVALLSMAVPMAAFVGLLAWMSGIQNAEVNANLLTGLMTTMSDVLFKIALVAPLAVIGVAALTALSGLAVALTGVLAILGGLSKIPGFNELIADGGESLALIGLAIGKFVGSLVGGLVGGFITGVASSLPMLGLCLSAFMINATPFIMGAKMVDETVLTGVGYLAGAILALTVADLITGITSFGQVGPSFALLGAELSAFMVAAAPFIAGARNLDPTICEGVKNLAETILILTGANLVDGLIRAFGGESSLTAFANELVPFGEAIVAFSNTVSGQIDEEAVIAAANAGKIMAEMSKEIPSTGGVLGWILGEKDLSGFADGIKAYGTAIKSFANEVVGLDLSGVAPAVEAGKKIADLATSIPTTGGLWQLITGEQSISDFAAGVKDYGGAIKDFANKVSGLDLSGVEPAVEAGKKIADLATNIPTTGGLWQLIAGEHSISDFAAGVKDYGGAIKSFGENVSDIDAATVKTAAEAGLTLAKMSSTIPTSGGLWQLIEGKKDLSNFSTQLANFGSAVRLFGNYVLGVDKFAVWDGVDAAKELVKMPSPATLIGSYSGLTNVQAFKSNLTNFGSAMKSYSVAVEGMSISAVSQSVSAINSLSKSSGIAGLVSSVCNAGANMSWFNESLTKFGSALKNYSLEVAGINLSALSGSTSEFNKLAKMVSGMSKVNFAGVSSFANSLGKIGKSGVDAFIKAFSDASNKVYKAGSNMIIKLIEGVKAQEPKLKVASKSLSTVSANAVSGSSSKLKSAGKDLGSGLIQGINAKKSAVYWAAYALGQMAVQGEKDGQQSNSPSKLTIKAGKWLGEGLVVGMQQMGDKVYGAGADLGKTATNTISSSISRIASAINTDIDSQPTIRPVLDLTDVKTGASALSSMLDMNSTVGVRANVGAISSMMNSRSQNGANDDVVSAIDKLRKDLGNIGGNTTYQVNGVTYDDGSNITEAVGNLVRAIKIEGRV